jgi:hypothetical protein
MQLTTTLALTSIFAAAVKAQMPMSFPSQNELESEAAGLFATNQPVYDSLTAYYATHTFSTGSQLASWASKFQTMDFSNVDPTQGLSQEQMSLIKSAYAEIPLSEVSDLLYQFFPTSIVGQVTEIQDNLSQFANYITATLDSQELTSSFGVSATATTSGSVKPGSIATEASVTTSATSAPISSSAANSSHVSTIISSSHSSAAASTSISSVSASAKASTSASSTASQSNAAAHMTLSATVVLGFSGAVAALALI